MFPILRSQPKNNYVSLYIVGELQQGIKSETLKTFYYCVKCLDFT